MTTGPPPILISASTQTVEDVRSPPESSDSKLWETKQTQTPASPVAKLSREESAPAVAASVAGPRSQCVTVMSRRGNLESSETMPLSSLRASHMVYAETTPELRAFVGRLVEEIHRDRFLQVAPDKVPETTSGSWYIPVNIGQKNFSFLCDTGRSVTAITPRIYGLIPSKYKTRIAGSNISLCTANGSDITLHGSACVELRIGGTPYLARVIVAALDCDGIIGMNFLSHYECAIDLSAGSLQFPHGTLYMTQGTKPQTCLVRVTDNTVIPPSSQMVLSACVEGALASSVGLVDPLVSTDGRFGILVGRSLVTSNSRVPVLVLNPGPAPAVLPQGGSLALLRSVAFVSNSDSPRDSEVANPGASEGTGLPVSDKLATRMSEQTRVVEDTSSRAASSFGTSVRHTCVRRPSESSGTERISQTGTPGNAEISRDDRVHPYLDSIGRDGAPQSPSSPDNFRSFGPLGMLTSGHVHPSLDSIDHEDTPSECSETSIASSNPLPRDPPAHETDLSARESRLTDPIFGQGRAGISHDLVIDSPFPGDRIDYIAGDDPDLHPDDHMLMYPSDELYIRRPLACNNLFLPSGRSPVSEVFGGGEILPDTVMTQPDSDELSSEGGFSESTECFSDIANSDQSDPLTPDEREAINELSLSPERREYLYKVSAKLWNNSDIPIGIPESLKSLIPSDLSLPQKVQLSRILSEYTDVFIGEDGVLGRATLFKHEIDTGQSKPIKQAPRRHGFAQQDIVVTELDKMLKAGIIEPSESPWASPIVLVRKKDGSTRFCIDYRKLNDVTKKDAYPLPHIEDALSTLAGSKYFCTLDLASGYWQVELSDDAKPKTAFCTRQGLFQFNVLPFGLSNAPATFERLMELVLKGLTWRQCVVYIDDIIVFGETFEDTLGRLTEVFNRLRSANLKLKPKKCFLFKPSTLYLGFQVSGNGVSPDPAKLEAVKQWSRPCTVKGVRSFLGFANYHRKFIPNYADMSEPLSRLTRKSEPFIWGETQQHAFDSLKQALTSAPVLVHPRREGEFILDTDASLTGIGGALYQVQDGEERVIGYSSKLLSRTQRNYCTTKRELLAVVRMVDYFRHYLWGTEFRIRTDHSSLRWLLNFKDADGMLARWLAKLSQYNFHLEYREGKSHLNADALSRRRCRGCPRVDCPDKMVPLSAESMCSESTDSLIDPFGFENPAVSSIKCEVKPLIENTGLLSRQRNSDASIGPMPKHRSNVASTGSLPTPPSSVISDSPLPTRRCWSNVSPGSMPTQRPWGTFSQFDTKESFELSGSVSENIPVDLSVCNMPYFSPEEDNNYLCTIKTLLTGDKPDNTPWWIIHTSQELRDLQSDDSDISQVIRWKNDLALCPERDVRLQFGAEVQSLLAQWDRLILRYGVLYRRPAAKTATDELQFVAPKSVRVEIMHLLHDLRTSGHLGVTKTFDKIAQRFYWPQYAVDIKRWVNSCPTCQARKGAPVPNRSPLQQQLIGAPFHRIGIDILDTRKISKHRNRYIMVVVDYFTKWSAAYPLAKQTASNVADKLVTQFISQFGVPLQILTDQGTQFEGKLFTELCNHLRVHKIRTSPYRPQTDGLVERQNRTLSGMISKFTNKLRNDWDEHLPYLMLAYNTTTHQSTGCTPFSLVFGRECNLPVDIIYPRESFFRDKPLCGSRYVEELRADLAYAHEHARRCLHKAATRQKREYDTHAREKPLFSVGDTVRYYYPPLRVGDKFASCWLGPYTILSRESDVNYKIKGFLRSGKEDIRIVHVDNLIIYEGDRRDLFARYNYNLPLSDQLEKSDYTEDPLLSNSLVSRPDAATSGAGSFITQQVAASAADKSIALRSDTDTSSVNAGVERPVPEKTALASSQASVQTGPVRFYSQNKNNILTNAPEHRLIFNESIPEICPDAVTEKSVSKSGIPSVNETLKLRRFKRRRKRRVIPPVNDRVPPPSLNIAHRPVRKRKKPNRLGFADK